MRNYILDFLNKQQPSVVYKHEERFGLFSCICRVWLSQSEEILSLFAVYTPTSLVDYGGSSNKVRDMAFYDRLHWKIRKHSDHAEAMSVCALSLTDFSTYFVNTCDMYVNSVRMRGEQYEGPGRLLNFNCVDATLGLFSVLYEMDGVVDHFVLIVGHRNFIKAFACADRLTQLFNYLFKGFFDIVWDCSDEKDKLSLRESIPNGKEGGDNDVGRVIRAGDVYPVEVFVSDGSTDSE